MKWADKIDMMEAGRAAADIVAALHRDDDIARSDLGRRFRRRASEVDAIHLDGSEAALRAVLALPHLHAAPRPDGISIATDFGRRTVLTGQWVTRDRATGTVRIEDAEAFAAGYEAI